MVGKEFVVLILMHDIVFFPVNESELVKTFQVNWNPTPGHGPSAFETSLDTPLYRTRHQYPNVIY